MIRNTALFTLIVFTFTLFAPAFMQPKEADAHQFSLEKYLAELTYIAIKDNDYKLRELYYKIFKPDVDGVEEEHNHTMEGDEVCKSCKSADCNGASEVCSGGWSPPGCGNPNYPCESNHRETSTCDNESCKHKGNEYRNCVGHTCEADIITGSGSYW